MPEGDTVYQAAGRLRRALDGEVLRYSQFRVPALATKDLSGRTIAAVRSRGKHLLIDIAATATQPAVSIHTHLKMEGEWHIPGRRPLAQDRTQERESSCAPAHTGPSDSELGIVELLTDPDATLAYLGPDLLGDDWDPVEATDRITAHPDTTIGEALLDQRLMAGVGNEYRSEICFLRGVHPATPVADVQVAPMVDLSRRLLWANKDRICPRHHRQHVHERTPLGVWPRPQTMPTVPNTDRAHRCSARRTRSGRFTSCRPASPSLRPGSARVRARTRIADR